MQISFRDRAGTTHHRSVSEGVWTEPDGSSPVDLTAGRSVPGLIDAHAHLSTDTTDFERAEMGAIRRRAWMALEHGIFLCLDKGYSDDVVLRLLDEPPDRRPTLQAAGRMIAAPGGYFPDFAQEVDESDLVEAVAERAFESAGWVKLVGDWPRPGRGAVENFGEDALRAAVDVAHGAGAKVAIHSMAGSAGPAVRAGVDSIEHGLFLDVPDLESLARRRGTWVPTISRMEQVRDQLRPDSSGRLLLDRGLDNVRRLLPIAADLGLAVLPGSDLALDVGTIGAEIVRLIEMGLPAERTVAWATEDGMLHNGVRPSFDIGRPADLVVFAADPAERPATIADPMFVMRHGRVLRRAGSLRSARREP